MKQDKGHPRHATGHILIMGQRTRFLQQYGGKNSRQGPLEEKQHTQGVSTNYNILAFGELDSNSQLLTIVFETVWDPWKLTGDEIVILQI